MLAIIIPYYKFTFFEATLESLASQTDQRFKAYIGDDASAENPSGLLEKYKGRFDFEYHRFEENLGGISLTQQWERCIALSGNEEWIMILGDDDYLDDSVVSSWYKNYNVFNTRSNVVRFATKIVNENIQNSVKKYTHPVWELAIDSFYRRFKGETRSSLSEHIFLKESFIKCRFSNYPLAWHSDDKAWLDFSVDKPIYTINKSVVFIRISSSSITGKLDNSNLKKIASSQFLKDIILQKIELFAKQHRLEILNAYERLIQIGRKASLMEWFVLSGLYLKNFNAIVFIKFVTRFLISRFRI